MSDQVREAEERLRKELGDDAGFGATWRQGAFYVRDDIRTVLDALSELRADAERLDYVEEYLEDLTWFHSKGGEPEPVLTWFIGDGSPSWTTQAPTFRAAIDAARASGEGAE